MDTEGMHGGMPPGKRELRLLPLRRCQTGIRPERGAHTHAARKIAWPWLVAHIGPATTPAWLEREPRAAGHRLPVVIISVLVFLCLRDSFQDQLLLVDPSPWLHLMQLARRGLDLRSTVGTEEVRPHHRSRVYLPVFLPTVASQLTACILHRLQLRQQRLCWLQVRHLLRATLLPHDWLPCPAKSAAQRMRQDTNHTGCGTFGALREPAWNIAVVCQVNHLRLRPRHMDFLRILLRDFLGCTHQH